MAERDNGGCGCLLVLGIGVAIYACSHKSPEKKAETEQAVVSGTADQPSGLDGLAAHVNPVRGDFDEDRAHDAAHDYISGETYESVMGSGDCSDDCSGHEAGWNWARDGNDCDGGDSNSFREGCEAFTTAVDDRVEEARKRYDNGDDTFAGEGD